MPKVNLSGPQKEIIDILAHVVIMSGIDKNVEGAQGILDRYLKDSLTPRQRAIYQEFQDHTRKVNKKLVAMLKKDKDRA